MKNVYDELYENKQLYIINDSNCRFDIENLRIAIVINLYYLDIIPRFLTYIKQIPDEIDCHIYSSNPQIITLMNNKLEQKQNCFIHKKENRGRDISALFVEFRRIAKEYDYFCFLHDKKEKAEYVKEDVSFWNENIWNNLIKNSQYINRVIELLSNDKIGFLAPPAPVGEYISLWYSNTWYENFENTVALAKKMELNCDIQYDKPSITLGTVFWCKTVALKKILDYEWGYNDFQDEPLPNDGTLSHAIERILPYVVQDAGYENGIIMCKDYAEQLLLKVQKLFYECFSFCQKEFLVESVHQLLNINEERNAIISYFSKYKDVYIYGAGFHGNKLLERMKSLGYSPSGFLVSDGLKEQKKMGEYTIYELEEILPNDEVGIFIAVSYDIQAILENNLKEYSFNNYYKVFIT